MAARLLPVVAACLTLLVPVCRAQDAPTAAFEATSIQAAKDLLALLVERRYEDVAAQFDETMAQALPAATLKAVWEGLAAQFGALQQTGEPRGMWVDGHRVVVIACGFEKASLDAAVEFDARGRVSGLTFQLAGAYSPPAYVRPESFTRHEEVVQSGDYRLPATLTMPIGDGPFPAMVLVHGSGPNDRDETLGPNKPFLDLAGGLAGAGVAVLAYDKRTLVYGERLAALERFTLREEVVEDAVAAAELLRHNPRVDSGAVLVLGHSLGGTAAPRIGASAPWIAGLVLLAAANEPLEDAYARQVEYLFGTDGTLSEEERAALEAIGAQVARVKDPALSPETPAAELPLGCPASYWLDLREYDPLATAAGLDMPILVVHGGRDYQVTQTEYERWREALAQSAGATFRLYPELNHLMMAGEGASTPEEYLRPGNVDARVVADIAEWVKGTR